VGTALLPGADCLTGMLPPRRWFR